MLLRLHSQERQPRRTAHFPFRLPFRIASLLACMPLVCAACERKPSAPAHPTPSTSAATPAPPRAQQLAAPMRAVVTLPPFKSLVQPLLPAGSEAVVLMKPGQSEHGYEFTSADIEQVVRADLTLRVGLGLESRLEGVLTRSASEQRTDLSMSAALNLQAPPQTPDNHAESDHADHDHDHDHDHGPLDPHLWLDPVLVKQLVPHLQAAIDAHLSRQNAPQAAHDDLRAAAAALLARIDEVDRAYADALKPFAGQSIITHHDAFSRLAQRYGLLIGAVIKPGHAESSPADIERVVLSIREQHCRAIYVEPQFSRATADRIAQAAGVRVLTLDPLGGEDWFATMHANLAALRGGFSPEQPK